MTKAFLLIGCVWSSLLAPMSAEAFSWLYDGKFGEEPRKLSVLIGSNGGRERRATGDMAGIIFGCDFDNRHVTLTLHPKSSPNLPRNTTLTNVQFQFDQKPVLRQTWDWLDEQTLAGKLIAGDLLNEAIESAQLVVEIGIGNTLHLDLAAARDDLLEFKRRCRKAIYRR